MLNDKILQNLKFQDKPIKKSDGYGLFILVTATAKLWRLAYRFDGKQKTLAFGSYPNIKLADARKQRDDARVLLEQGIDPGAVKKQEAAQAAGTKTFGEWADAWLAKERAIWDVKTVAGKERYVEYLKEEFGSLRVDDVKRPAAIAFLKKFEAEGKLETRDRVRSVGELICVYADIEGNDHNPFRSLKGQLIQNESTPRPGLTNTDAVAKLFKGINGDFDGARFEDIVGEALRFQSLTAVRPGEVADAEWSEIDFETARWTISAAKMKMRHEHVVPLSRQAIALLRRVEKITGGRRFIFSCRRDTPISDNSLNKRLRALGYDTTTTHCAHGFRTTFSTLCHGETDKVENKLWDGDVIELALAHLDTSSVKAIYNRTGPLSLIGARAKLLQHWADRIDSMIGNNVVTLAA